MKIFYRFLLLLMVIAGSGYVFAADKTVTLQLRWMPQFQFAGYYVALAKGYYKDERLDVQILPGEGNRTQVMEEVLSGRADFGIGNSGLALAALQGDAVTVLADIFQRSASVLLVKPGLEGSISTLGHRNLALRSLNDNPELYAVFQHFGLAPSQLPRLSTSKYDLDAFIRGDFDAINGYISNEPYTLKQKGVPYKVVDPMNYGINFYGDALFARSDFVSANGDLVQAFVRASLRGWKYALDHQDEAIAILQAGPAPNLSKDRLLFEASAIESLVMPDIIPLGNINQDRWERIADTFKSLGLASPTAVLPESFFISNWVDKSRRQKTLLWIVGATALTLVILLAYVFQHRSASRLKALLGEKNTLLQRVEQLVNHDVLTGLPNRRMLQERLERLIAHAARNKTQFAVCFIDLNRFKQVNDQLNHEAGDQVLVHVSRVLQQTVRDVDTVSRVGGDEFVILLDGVESPSDVKSLESRLRESLKNPFVYEDNALVVDFTLGYSMYPADGLTAETLLKVADIAMCQSKAMARTWSI